MSTSDRYVTYVYKIVDQAAWEKVNPFNQPVRDGMKCITVSRDDKIEALRQVQDELDSDMPDDVILRNIKGDSTMKTWITDRVRSEESRKLDALKRQVREIIKQGHDYDGALMFHVDMADKLRELVSDATREATRE